jgi:UDP-glucose 4-epimerase
MKKAIVTGARGFIGRHLSRALFDRGWEVYGLGNGAWPSSEAHEWGVHRWLAGGINAANLRLLQDDAGTPDAIFHLAGGASVGAAIANPHEDFHKTVVSTVELLEWVRMQAPDSPMVAVSSAAVYGAGHDRRIRESDVGVPFSPYGHHKRMMEAVCTSYSSTYGIKTIVGRLFSVFGSGLKKQLPWDLCSRLASGEGNILLGGSGSELRDWTDVRDVARAVVGLVDDASSSSLALNVGTGIGSTVADVAHHMAAVWAARTGQTLARIGFSGIARPGDPFSLVADPARLSGKGFQWHVDWREGIAHYIDWYIAEKGIGR